MPTSSHALRANMNNTIEESAGCQNNGRRIMALPISRHHARGTPILDHNVINRRRQNRQIIGLLNGLLHGQAIELAVSLCARALNRGAFAAIKQAELNTSNIRHSAHQAIQRINLAHQMALANTANGRIARHFADCLELMGQQHRARAITRRRRRRFATGVPATNNNDIPMVWFCVHGAVVTFSARKLKRRHGQCFT